MRFTRRLLFVLGATGTFVLTLVGQSVRVLSVSGEVTAQEPGELSPRVLKVGDSVIVGTRIVTGAGGRVILTPLPGIKSILSPGTDLVIERVSSSTAPGSSVALQKATLDLRTGAITSDLERTKNVALDYQIRTARGVAGARGTTYTVAVDLAGLASVVVTQGSISLTLTDGRVIELAAGQITVTRPDGASRTVARAAELDAGDQAAASGAIVTTIEALAGAIEQGVALQPEALENALRVAQELGVVLDPLTQEAVERARRILAERTLQDDLAEAGAEAGDGRDDQASEVVTDSLSDDLPELGFLDRLSAAQRAAYDALTSAQKRAFSLLPSDTLRLLILDINELNLTSYALALGEDGGLLRAPASIEYAAGLSADRREVFVERSDELQGLLAGHPADRDFTAFALDLVGECSSRPESEVLFYLPLSLAERARFQGLNSTLRRLLVEARDAALTAFALRRSLTEDQIGFVLELSSATRPTFLALPHDTQELLLAHLGDGDLLDFALATDGYSTPTNSFAVVAYYRELHFEARKRLSSFPTHLREGIVADTLLATLAFANEGSEGGVAWLNSVSVLEHYLDLGGLGTSEFAARPADLRELFAAYGRPGLTRALLNPATFPEKLIPTESRLRGVLTALNRLSIENQQLFEELAGGPAFPLLASAPAPDEWSNGAFSRTGRSWRSLSENERSQLRLFSATGAIMERSGSYVEEALKDFNRLDQPTRDAIRLAGWGNVFTAYFTSEEVRKIFAQAGALSPSEVDTLRQLSISPSALIDRDDPYYEDVRSSSLSPSRSLGTKEVNAVETTPYAPLRADRLAALAALPLADRALLAELDIGDEILAFHDRYVPAPSGDGLIRQTYAETLQTTVVFARELTEPQRRALREMGTGYWLHEFYPTQGIDYNYEPLLARDVVRGKIEEYLALDDARRQAARDTRLFSDLSFYYGRTSYLNEYAEFLDAWLALPAATRNYLAAEGAGLPLLDIFRYGGSESYYRSWAQLVTLIGSLDEHQLSLLSDLDASTSLGSGFALPRSTDSAIAALKGLLAYVDTLDDLQRFTLTELGIVGAPGTNREHQGLFFADRQGLARLLTEYSQLDKAIRSDTRQIDPDTHFNTYEGNNFFFAADHGQSNPTYDVSFVATGDLRVGATRQLALLSDNYYSTESENGSVITFNVPAGKDLHLRAADLIDLNGVRVSSEVRAITMAAVTINLADFNFPGGSRAALTSRDGGLNFDGSIVGKVNFLYGVTYDGVLMHDDASFNAASRGNIDIGSFASPAVIPATYTPPHPGLSP